ncbi:SMI1/KNR4 family protein [Candidatus Bodocaedibacter vickermanii]|uniref:Antitoxin with SUKH family nuclease toxin immunity domain n=1 Tax=Candidatus Bodocaedibacter vickermanii TaxID=2741701 RepID=A0A7L9RS76_9PROT|nr:Putative antitoxin with SUKH family nuclease toxin immunity domain [Candidatus Paracaedibacteraceae bacterium 'Lake Konstanz']
MILNIEDLLEHCRKHATASPIIAEDILISVPGIPDEEYTKLIKAFTTLPESYLNFIKTYDIKQVTIGNYKISVCKDKREETVDRLLYWNDREEEIQDIQKMHDLTFIASNDIDDIYVAGTKSDYKEGEILSIDHELYWEENVPIKRVAPNYETFLIICANKYQLQMTDGIDGYNIMEALRLRLDALNLPKEYYDYWVW